MKVKIISDNVEKHTEILRSLATIGQEVEVEANLSELKELLKHTAENPVIIKKLILQEDNLKIEDNNVAEYAETFASLPTFEKAECSGKIHISIQGGEADASSLLKELSRNKFNIHYVSLNHNFRRSELSAAYAEAINSVLKNCLVENYMGHLTPQITSGMFQHLNGALFASIQDKESFNVFKEMIVEEKWGELRWLRFSISPRIDPEALLPLPGDLSDPPQLFMRDVDEESVESACNIAWKLKPSAGSRVFYHMYFPRCQLSQEGIKKLLNGLRIKVGPVPGHLIFPTKCRPSSEEEEKQLQTLGYEIVWGNDGNMNIFDTDSW